MKQARYRPCALDKSLLLAFVWLQVTRSALGPRGPRADLVTCNHAKANKGLSPWCLAGLQAEWFDWTELESQDRSARPRIETSHEDRQDVRSAKLQACMKSAKPTHLTRELERTKRFKRPGTELDWATTTGS